uniref:NKAP domain containing 1 n=1 Tax=Cyprinus carpio carpio TaxID=630221 RepID=A0A9J7ZGM1_CYPCA
MSKVSMGKVLLRNVIRHTDAHNKIQEESEMWKMRDLERQTLSAHLPKHRGGMHCDRYLEGSEGSMRERLGDRRDEMSERDEKEARYWTQKLYEFEANDPDRWGHSGFKELYPEEFYSDGEKDCSDSKHRRKKHKNKPDADIEKSSKKSSKKKKKKKEKKRRKSAASGSETCSGEEDTGRRTAIQTQGRERTGRETALKRTRCPNLKGKSGKTGKWRMRRDQRRALMLDQARRIFNSAYHSYSGDPDHGLYTSPNRHLMAFFHHVCIPENLSYFYEVVYFLNIFKYL